MIAVIDSAQDTTRLLKLCGVDTYLASDILPEVGDKRGKGETCGRPYISSKGISFVMEADITNIHPRFVYGLVALDQVDEALCKSLYDRR